jgi:hypothetical protein
MSAWTDLVKKLCKENPGKPLGAILPLAKKMYKKPDAIVVVVDKKNATKKVKKMKKVAKKGKSLKNTKK